MKRLSDEVIWFFQNQGYVVVATIDDEGTPHSACKGIVKISRGGKIYLLDLYKARTYQNLMRSPNINITAVDEHEFVGYCLKGKARIIMGSEIKPSIIKAWEDRITSRLTRRVLRNIREEKSRPRHPEVLLPKPEYLIIMDVEEIVDLIPHHLR